MSATKKQTAVEWLVDFFESGVSSVEEWTKAKEQAKAMEKEQHRDTWLDSFVYHENDNYIGKTKTFEEYYQETYEKQ